MKDEKDILEIKTGRESGVALKTNEILLSYLRGNNFSMSSEKPLVGIKIINKESAILGYLYTPEFCNIKLDSDYKWLILWV